MKARFLSFALAAMACALCVLPARADIDAAWLGGWIGDVKSPPTAAGAVLEMPISVLVKRGAGDPVVEVTVVRIGALAKPATEIIAEGRTLGFTLDAAGQRARFEGTLSADAKSMSGSFSFIGPDGRPAPPALPWSMRRVDLVRELPAPRIYDATLDALGQKIPMRLALAEGPLGWCGSLEVAAQGVRDLAVDVRRTEAGFVIRLPLGAVAMLELTADEKLETLDGTFQQGTFRGPIRWAFVPDAKLAAPRRAQDPVPPFPYIERQITIAHPAGHRLSGTITIPTAESPLARDGRMPGIVLVSGSGPQDRDESLMGHRPFAVLADALTRAGVVVLRYDDRGMGSSTGEFAGATTLQFATDADLASQALKAQPEVDPKRVGMLGHSEGALIAPLVGVWQNSGDHPVNPLAFLVLLAPPVEPCGFVLTRQTQLLYDAAGVPPEQSRPAVEAHARVMQAMMERRTTEEVRPLVDELVRRQIQAAGQELPTDELLRPTLEQAAQQLFNPWMITFIQFDPRTVYARNELPILAMGGTKDVQVDARQNLALLTRLTAPSGRPAEVRIYDGLNHLFQPATTGSPDEYGLIDTTFDPKALSELVAWVVATAQRVPAMQIPEAGRPELDPSLTKPPFDIVPQPTKEGEGAEPAAEAGQTAPAPAAAEAPR